MIHLYDYVPYYRYKQNSAAFAVNLLNVTQKVSRQVCDQNCVCSIGVKKLSAKYNPVLLYIQIFILTFPGGPVSPCSPFEPKGPTGPAIPCGVLNEE